MFTTNADSLLRESAFAFSGLGRCRPSRTIARRGSACFVCVRDRDKSKRKMIDYHTCAGAGGAEVTEQRSSFQSSFQKRAAVHAE